MQVTTSITSVHAKDPDAQPGGVDDMTKLAYLHEPGVLYNLASRYELDEIYVSFKTSLYLNPSTPYFVIIYSKSFCLVFDNTCWWWMTDIHREYLDCNKSFCEATAFVQ